MNNSIWTDFFPLGQAFGWTIVHSLWQITLIGLALRLLLWMIGRQQARVRYGVLLTGLLLALVWSSVTFAGYWVEMSAPQIGEGIAQGSVDIQINSGAYFLFVFQDSKSIWTFVEDIHQQLGPYIPFIGGLWLLGLIFYLVKMALGFNFLSQLQRSGQIPENQLWRDRVEQLARQMKVKRAVRFLLTDRINVPVTFRFYKPVILFPAALFTGLNPEQIEVLILHELAHIRRQDYLVNIVQSVIEVLFFYHPFIWWMSGEIRQEREYGCDDLVIKTQQNPFLYAETLTRLHTQHSLIKTNLAMSANSRKGTFSKRIFRLFGQYDQRPSLLKSGILMILLLTAVLAQAFYLPEIEKDSNSTLSVVEIPVVSHNQDNDFSPVPEPKQTESKLETAAEKTSAPESKTRVESDTEQKNEVVGLKKNNILDTSTGPSLLYTQNTSMDLKPLANIERDMSIPVMPLMPQDTVPIFIVNGKIVGGKEPLNEINPNKIERIIVWKGEKAVKRFGEKGKNGVIEIFLKGYLTEAQKKEMEKNRIGAETKSIQRKKISNDGTLVTGTVLDSNKQPLIGVNIIIKGTKNGTITDFYGNFSLKIPDSCADLVMSYVGKETKVLKKVCEGTDVEVELMDETK